MNNTTELTPQQSYNELRQRNKILNELKRKRDVQERMAALSDELKPEAETVIAQLQAQAQENLLELPRWICTRESVDISLLPDFVRRYLQLKSRYSDAWLFYQDGEWLYAFFEDAIEFYRATKVAGLVAFDTDAGPIASFQLRPQRSIQFFKQAMHDGHAVVMIGEGQEIEFRSGQPVKESAKPQLAPATVKRIAKLRSLADGLQDTIDDKFRPSTQRMTRKRAREIEQREEQGLELSQVQTILRRIADGLENQNLPEPLSKISAKSQILSLLSGWFDPIPSAGIETKENFDSARAILKQWIVEADLDRLPAHILLAQQMRAIALRGYPGFFPTPHPIALDMADAADLVLGARVLEPNAGIGSICRAILEICPTVQLDVVEWQLDLRQVLEMQGYNLVGRDFLEFTGGPYDAIIMNPPFEQQQDIDHVLHAFSLLAPGGRLVALVCSASIDPDSNRKKIREFYEFLVEVEAQWERLPNGAFLESDRPTAVAISKIFITRPATDEQVASLFRATPQTALPHGLEQVAKLPPVFTRYAEISDQLPNALLFVLKDGRWEAFWDNAVAAAIATDLESQLITIEADGETIQVPMVGFDHSDAPNWVAELTRNGCVPAVYDPATDEYSVLDMNTLLDHFASEGNQLN